MREILAAGYAAQPPPPPSSAGSHKGRQKQSQAKNLLDALLLRAEQVLARLIDLRIPFTNNQAERDLRWAKVQQKIAGTFRSATGATAFCRIRSYLSTMQKQGHPMLSALTAVFHGHPYRSLGHLSSYLLQNIWYSAIRLISTAYNQKQTDRAYISPGFEHLLNTNEVEV
jgi:hypothetical protein